MMLISTVTAKIEQTVAPDFRRFGSITWKNIGQKHGNSFNLVTYTRKTQEVVRGWGGEGGGGRGGNYNQANSTLILPCILSVKSCSRLPELSQNLQS